MQRASILLANDNSSVLSHVTNILEKDYDIVGAVSIAASVLRDWPRLKPDLVVLDISMGKEIGIDLACRMRDSGCNAKIVFLTVHEDTDFVRAAMAAGCSGYVVKSRMATDLIPAIQAALAGKLFVSASLLYQGD